MNYPVPNVRKLTFLCLLVMGFASTTFGQSPGSCAGVSSRNNSNGQATSCPNVSGTAYASNFAGTIYAIVPLLPKTGNLQLQYPGVNPSLTPFAITRVWLTNSGTTIQTVVFGPAGVPTISGGNTQVNYCFYGSNLATIGTLSFELTDPQTNTVWGICSYDASCNSNCSVVSNPSILPVELVYFRATANAASVQLNWETAQEENNKGFEIQRSLDDSLFSPIGFLPSANPQGNSQSSTAYAFSDMDIPERATVSYRLRQVDLDGHSIYSRIASVSFSNIPTMQVRAAGAEVLIDFRETNQHSSHEVNIYDTQGRRLRLYHLNASATEFTVSGLPAQKLYFISVLDEKGKIQVVRPVYLAE